MSTTYMPYSQHRSHSCMCGGGGTNREERGDEGAAEGVEERAAERSESAEGGGESIVKQVCLGTMDSGGAEEGGATAVGVCMTLTAGHRGKGSEGSQWGDTEGIGVGGGSREEMQWFVWRAGSWPSSATIPLFCYFRIPDRLMAADGDHSIWAMVALESSGDPNLSKTWTMVR
ncbi:hypothetical protein DFH07DRAFT_768303 [Mycena maculata]|uniref:Uncharacterized protein n=1 Tax=Mycena maculata TaxID=230809 RepID=A0AAD7NQV6_9AGAR|nr:hypothetical protein DFH07DRAFT_768303 [Mycena maculata]